MKHLGLFEGIGGFSLAARWMNWETATTKYGWRCVKVHITEIKKEDK